MTSNIAAPLGDDYPDIEDGVRRTESPLTVAVPVGQTALEVLVLSKRKRITLTREQLMVWVAQESTPYAVLDRIVGLFTSEDG